MIEIKNIEIGTTINIVPDTPLLGKTMYANVLAVCSYEMAKAISEVDVKHQQIFSSIETPNVDPNHRLYDYVIIEVDGVKEAYATAWMKSATVVNKISIELKINIDSKSEVEPIRRALLSLGHHDFELKMLER